MSHTKICGTTSTLIDHIVFPTNVQCAISVIQTDLSDHKLLIVEPSIRKLPKEKTNVSVKINYTKLNNYFQNNEFVPSNNNVNDVYNEFIQYINSGTERASYHN